MQPAVTAMENTSISPDAMTAHANECLASHENQIYSQTSRLFAILMTAQWIAGIAAACWISPRTWAGPASSIHIHVWLAILLGGAITALPVTLALTRPCSTLTRQTVGICQMMMSALLIHLSGGRIETHFHVFGSLAFLAYYRDWRTLIPATIVVATDHAIRGIYFPESVFGDLASSPWRWMEHAGWVIFEDIILINFCVRARKEMREIATGRAATERAGVALEEKVRQRTADLERAKEKAEAGSRAKSEFLANISHEIRTPMNSVLNMTELALGTRMTREQKEYVGLANASAESLLVIINDILDFSNIEADRVSLETAIFRPRGSSGRHHGPLRRSSA